MHVALYVRVSTKRQAQAQTADQQLDRLRKLRAGTLLPWTRPPYGCRLDPERPRDPAGVRLDEAEAAHDAASRHHPPEDRCAMVRDLFAWFADEGQPLYGFSRVSRANGRRCGAG